MSTDVFLRLAPQSMLRAGLALAVIERWKMEPDINLRVIAGAPMAGAVMLSKAADPEVVLALPEVFHWRSRLYAESHASTDPYILADDDRLILGENWVKRALALWERASQEEFVLLSDNSPIASERQRPADVGAWGSNLCPEYFDAPHQAGANYLAKKGTINYSSFSAPPNRQDEEVANYLKSRGHRFGFMRDVLSNHVGFGYSQAQPLLFNRY